MEHDHDQSLKALVDYLAHIKKPNGPDRRILEQEFSVHLALTDEERQRYAVAYKELCFAVTGKAPRKEPPPEQEFIASVATFIFDRRDDAYIKICVEFDYCTKRKVLKEKVSGVDPLLAALAGVLGHYFGAAVTWIGAGWLVSTWLLDKLCECDKL